MPYKKHEIELWALRVIEALVAGQPTEDAQVELKARWPAAGKVARRLAGHANAAQGEPILWLIGVDEKARKIVGADDQELSDWWAQVKAEFDGQYPRMLTDKNILTAEEMVVAMLFETDDPPYVVRNPEGGPVRLEVPWREGRAIRTATRHDLLRILSPLSKMPSIEVIGAMVHTEEHAQGKDTHRIGPWADVYIVPQGEGQVVIPHHRLSGWVKPDGYSVELPLEGVAFNVHSQSSTIKNAHSELLVTGPGLFRVIGRAYARLHELADFPDSGEMLFRLGVVGQDAEVIIHATGRVKPI